ncbi:MAG: TRAP transporter large permease [Desulfobacterales bacterium]|jgi:tripartite ATP-independent transporter DctM subunit
MISLLLLIIMVALMAVRVPVSIAIGIAVTIALLVGDFPLDVIPTMMVDGLDSFPLLAVPFFVLAGNLMNAGGITRRIFAFARALFGPIRGGLAQVNVAASMIFAGMSGAALADLAGLGAVEMEAMRKNGYPEDISAAVTLASCTVGPIIPPSIVLIVYGLATNTSVGRLFLGGVFPGILIGLMCMLFIYLWVRIKGTTWGQSETFRIGEFWRSFKSGTPALLSPVLVIGAIITGVASPTEVGALAAAYAFLVGLIYRELTLRRLISSLIESTTTTAVIMYLIAVSIVMGWIITIERVPHEAAQAITTYIQSPMVGMLIINLFLIVVGMFLETLPALLILSPILLPVVKAFGIDPVHFGVIICFNLIIGIITPPMGIGIFVAARVAKLTPEQVLRKIIPFFIPLLVGLLLISLLPNLTLWLPNKVFGVSP